MEVHTIQRPVLGKLATEWSGCWEERW